MTSLINFITESFDEIRHRVTWPTPEELERVSNLFLIGLLVCALFVSIVNISWERAAQWLYGKF